MHNIRMNRLNQLARTRIEKCEGKPVKKKMGLIWLSKLLQTGNQRLLQVPSYFVFLPHVHGEKIFLRGRPGLLARPRRVVDLSESLLDLEEAGLGLWMAAVAGSGLKSRLLVSKISAGSVSASAGLAVLSKAVSYRCRTAIK